MSTIKLIAAVDLDGGIGKNGQMPWPRIKSDLQRFKTLTTGHPVIMGRVTAESIGRPLPNRTNIVVTTKKHFEGGWALVGNWRDAIPAAEAIDTQECWIIGGAEIYEIAMRCSPVNEIHLTTINGRYECDRMFPRVNLHEWQQIGERVENDASEPVKCSYRVFRRVGGT